MRELETERVREWENCCVGLREWESKKLRELETETMK